jgi:hypothetical protein
MMMVVGLSVVSFLTIGVALCRAKRARLAQATTADGFKSHEVRKAMRLHARGKENEFTDYCRDVVERNARQTKQDWTKAGAYRELV